jgi:5-methylcytosine-specific restriction endonuclease McrA
MKYNYLNEIFKKDSEKISRSTVRDRAIKNKVLPYKCSKCGNDGKWENEALTLELHHINGKSKDNSVENLEFLCPNCHSQTKTWRRKKS